MAASIVDLCPEWEDDDRMNALFAPLRSKELNPESWNSKVRFWIDLIEKCCLLQSTVLCDLSTLKTALTRRGKSPYCLQDVLKEGFSQGNLSSPGTYIEGLRAPHLTWGSWVLGLGATAVKSVGSKVLGASVDTFVVPRVVDKIKSDVYQQLTVASRFLPSYRVCLVREDQVDAVLGALLEPVSRDFMLQVLLEERKIFKFSLDKQVFYKVALEDDKTDLSDIDKGLLHLKVNLDHLSREIPALEERARQEKLLVKKQLKLGSRTAAKTALLRHKKLEQQVEKLHSQQLNLEHVYEQLLAAESNKKIIEAYNSGLAAMKSMVDPSLVDSAQKTMFELAELLDVNKEISDTLAHQEDMLELDSLEAELAALVAEPGMTGMEAAAVAGLIGQDAAAAAGLTDQTAPALHQPGSTADYDTLLNRLESLEVFDLHPVIGVKKQKMAETLPS